MSKSSDGSEFKTDITADPAQFQAGMKQAADAALNASNSIKGHFDAVGKVFESVSKNLMAVAGVVAGGKFFKDAIAESIKLTGETMMLSKRLDMAGEAASALNTALGDIGSDSETYIGAFDKFAKQLKNNEQGLQAMGLKTRDANGSLRDSNSLFTEALATVGEYRPGLDQTTAAMTLFGKGVEDAMKLQRLNNGVLEEARRKNEELGLTITQEGVAAAKKYKAAMNDVGDVFTALKNAIGQQVMPIFTELANGMAAMGPTLVAGMRLAAETIAFVWRAAGDVVVQSVRAIVAAVQDLLGPPEVVAKAFGDAFGVQIPGAMQIFRNALAIVEAALISFRMGVQVVVTAVAGAFNWLGSYIGAVGATIALAVKGDFAGASVAWKAGADDRARIIQQGFDKAVQYAVKGRQDLDNALVTKALQGDAKATPVGAPKGGTKVMGDFSKTNGGPEKDKSRMGLWEAQLSETKLAFQEIQNAEGSFRQMSLADETAYWRKKLALTQAGTPENIAVRRKLAETQLNINKEAFAAQVAQLKAEADAWKNNTDERLAVLNREAALVRQRYGAESKEYAEVQKQIVDAKRQAADQLKQIDEVRVTAARNASLAEIAVREDAARLDVQLGVLNNAQLLALQQQLEDQRTAIQQKALQERLELTLQDPDRNPVELAKILGEMAQLEEQHQQRLRQIRAQATVESSKGITGVLSSVQSGWANLIASAMQGTVTLGGFVRGIFQTVAQALVQAGAQMLAQWVVQKIAMAVFGKGAALTAISEESGKAGAAGVASMAGAPFPLNMYAPAFGAEMAAAAASFAAVASAEGGFDIPGFMNPVTQLHAKEMVLPAKYADVIRQQADGGPAAGAAAQPAVPLQVVPMPGDFWMVNRHSLAKALDRAHKDKFRS